MPNDIENKETESLREFLTDDSHIDIIEMAKIICLHCPPSHPEAISGVAEGPMSGGAGRGANEMNKSKLNRAEVFAKYASDGWSGDAVAMDERSFNAALDDLFGHECLQFDCDGMCDAPQNHIKQGADSELRLALEDANGLCRSAYSIAERKGLQTNWDSFTNQLKKSLKIQHRIMYPEGRVVFPQPSPSPEQIKEAESGEYPSVFIIAMRKRGDKNWRVSGFRQFVSRERAEKRMAPYKKRHWTKYEYRVVEYQVQAERAGKGDGKP